jgi:hypothetical protein
MTRFLLWPIWILQLFGGAKSFVGNPLLGSATLNGWGLHTTRVRLAHAATQLRWWLLAPLAAAELRQRFRTQGYLVLENYLPPADFERLKVAIEACRAEVREMRQGDTLTLRVLLDDDALVALPPCRALLARKEFINLLRYCAATLRWPHFYVQCIKHGASHDPQKDLHADTFHPTMKAWLFLSDADVRNGPFTFVPGSQRPTAARLAWEREQSLCAGGGNRYSAKGSLRIAEAELSRLGLPPAVALSVRANTLVIANTHGFHRRGDAPPGSSRLEIYASSRSNPFLPLPLPGSRLLSRVEHRIVAAYYRHLDRQAAARGTRSSWHIVPCEQLHAAVAGLPASTGCGAPPAVNAPPTGSPPGTVAAK